MGPHIAQIGCLNIQVRRSHVLEDALRQLQMHMDDLRKPLKVNFLGGEHGNIREEAVDEGMLTPLPPAVPPCRRFPLFHSPCPCVKGRYSRAQCLLGWYCVAHRVHMWGLGFTKHLRECVSFSVMHV